MSDIIICLNFDESKKKNRTIIETYEGYIPNLKSKKFSGQLRNVNINSKKFFDNINSFDLNRIIVFLNMNSNIQISKNQYMISSANIKYFNEFLNLGCFFYKFKKYGMFKISSLVYGYLEKDDLEIDGIKYKFDKDSLKIYYKKINNIDLVNIIPSVFIDIESTSYILNVEFDYNGYKYSYNYSNEQNDVIRDFAFESKIISDIKKSGWKFDKLKGFIYEGNQIEESILKLKNNGIKVYTNKGIPVATVNYSNVNVSYGIDWFDIKGDALIDESKVDITKLIELKSKKINWIELSGKFIHITDKLVNKNIKLDKGYAKIEKKDFVSAMCFSQTLNGKNIKNFDSLISFNSIRLDIDENIVSILRPYQIVGVKWLLALKSNGFGGCLSDDMGLGKTLQVIAFLTSEKLRGEKTLIVVPKTLLVNWDREIKKFTSALKVMLYYGANRSVLEYDSCDIVLTTYRTIINDYETIRKLHFNNLIVDEAQYIKNPKSQAYKTIDSLKIDSKFIMTGTPFENNINEFIGLMNLINRNCFRDLKISLNDKIDNIRLICAPFILRRLKKDVLKELPNKQEQSILISMENGQRQLYDKLLESVKYELCRKPKRFEIKSNSAILNGLLYLQEVCCHPLLLPKELNPYECNTSAKFKFLLDLLENLYSSGHKVVVFSRFTKMLKLIESEVIHKHYNYYYLDGHTRDRMSIVDDFERAENGIFLISLKAGGTGLNLISADTAIIFDPWWNPAIERQAMDRIYRIGQKKNVMIYKLIMENTIEEKVQSLQNEKDNIANELLHGHDQPTEFSSEVLKKLL